METESFTDFPVENKIPPIAPDAPTNLHAKGISTTEIDLSWDAPQYTGGADITGYRIEVSTTGTGGWSDLVADTGSTSTTYSHTVPLHATRYYRVSAINSAGTGDPSSAASASAMNTPPGVIGAEIRGNSRIVTLFLDEASVHTPTPPASAFTINVDGTVRTAGALTVTSTFKQVKLVFAGYCNQARRDGDRLLHQARDEPATGRRRTRDRLVHRLPRAEQPRAHCPGCTHEPDCGRGFKNDHRTLLERACVYRRREHQRLQSRGLQYRHRELVQPGHRHGLDVDGVFAHGAVGRHTLLPGFGDQLRRHGTGIGRGLRHGHEHPAQGDPRGDSRERSRHPLAVPRRSTRFNFDTRAIDVHRPKRKTTHVRQLQRPF